MQAGLERSQIAPQQIRGLSHARQRPLSAPQCPTKLANNPLRALSDSVVFDDWPVTWRDPREKQLRSRSLTLDYLDQKSGHPVLDVLAARHREGSQPGARSDGCRVAVVVEGGGMRGAVSGAMLLAIRELGMHDSIDVVYGSSAGAINLTYYLAGQEYGLDAYCEELACKRFMDLSRLLPDFRRRGRTRRPALDLDILIDEVMNGSKPLAWDDVIDSPVPLKVVASCLDTLRSVSLDDFVDQADLEACLRASATVPRVAGPPIEHRGRRLVDAAIFEAIPYLSAVADGCTHILALCTRSAPGSGRLQSKLLRGTNNFVKRGLMRSDYTGNAWSIPLKGCPGTGLTQDEMLLSAMSDDSQDLPFFRGARVLPVYPGAIGSYPPVCIDPPVLASGIREGKSVMSAVLKPLCSTEPSSIL